MNVIKLVTLLTLVISLAVVVESQLSSTHINWVYGNLTSLGRTQADWCGLRDQLASTNHVGWVVTDIIPPLKVIFNAYKTIKPEMVTTTWLCDTIKVWTLVVDQAYSKRACQNDKWCEVNYSDLTVPSPKPAYCTSTYCGANPGKTCVTAAEWKGKCKSASNRCPIICFHIKGTNYASYQAFTSYLYSLTWNYKKRELSEQIKRILSRSSAEAEESTEVSRNSERVKRLSLFRKKNVSLGKKATETAVAKKQTASTCNTSTKQCGWCDPWSTGDCGTVCSSWGAATGDPCMYSGKCCICIIY
eukprot:TRINITY_DN4281_c0_g1_i1.p1 TRINITY_DN4281_c0_g1~~TRINITY_DN4281_c0_g1_i1.p1  ORF type:complete len:302 (-),score=71.02 TRINITY_DN4281_c0_g1_i1:124-1029(-)